MTASQALALSRALLLAHDVLTGAETGAFVSNAGEGAQGGHPQRLPVGEAPVASMTTEQCLGYMLKYSAKSTQAGEINWLALLTLAAITGFWVAFGLALDSALQAGAM